MLIDMLSTVSTNTPRNDLRTERRTPTSRAEQRRGFGQNGDEDDIYILRIIAVFSFS